MNSATLRGLACLTLLHLAHADSAARLSLDMVLAPVVSVARCRAQCVADYRHRGALIHSDLQCLAAERECGECWRTCALLVDAPVQASSVCKSSTCVGGCVLACSILQHSSSGRSTNSQQQPPCTLPAPLVSIVDDRVRVYWNAPVPRARPQHNQRAFVFVLLWRVGPTSDWAHVAQTLATRTTIFDRHMARASSSEFWLLAVSPAGVQCETGLQLNNSTLITDSQYRQHLNASESAQWSIVFMAAVCVVVLAASLLVAVAGLLAKNVLQRVQQQKISVCQGYALRRELGVTPGRGYLTASCQLQLPPTDEESATYEHIDRSLNDDSLVMHNCSKSWLAEQTVISVSSDQSYCDSPKLHVSRTKAQLFSTPTRHGLWPQLLLGKYAGRGPGQSVISSIGPPPALDWNGCAHGPIVFGSPCTSCAPSGMPQSPIFI